jgi:hypothetical protein
MAFMNDIHRVYNIFSGWGIAWLENKDLRSSDQKKFKMHGIR